MAEPLDPRDRGLDLPGDHLPGRGEDELMDKPLDLAEWRWNSKPTAFPSDPRALNDVLPLLAEMMRLREAEILRAMEDMGTSSLAHHILRPLVGWERSN